MRASTTFQGVLILAGAALASPNGFNYWDVSDTSQAPRLLSQTGLYADIPTGTMIGAATYYDVNSPAWSDGAAMKRWVILRPGRRITFKEKDDYWDYPDSSVFVQQLAVDTVNGDGATRVLWETRLLLLKKEMVDPANPAKIKDHWYGFSYRWRAGQLEADLVPDMGVNATIGWWPEGRGAGKPRILKKWTFPSRDQCQRCHLNGINDTLHGRSVLGFFTAQLNRPSPLVPGINQREDFFRKGLLQGDKPAGVMPDNWDVSPRWWGLKATDPRATTDTKARAYLAANCSGCHGERGVANRAAFPARHTFDFHIGQPAMDLANRTTLWHFGLDTVAPASLRPALMVPGYPQKSVIYHRQRVRNTAAAGGPDAALAFDLLPEQMPPLPTFEVDEQAMEVLADWIIGYPPAAVPEPPRRALAQPAIRDRSLVLPPGTSHSDPPVGMVAIDGRVHILTRIGPGVYRIPAHLPAGMYLVRAGRHGFFRCLF